MKRLVALACVGLALPWTATAADAATTTDAAAAGAAESAESRLATYYSIHFEDALMAMRVRAMYLVLCADQFAAQCSAELKAAVPGAKARLETLDRLTLFRQRVRFPEGQARDHEQFRRILDGLGDELLTLAPTYELRLFGRYGATLRACPPEAATQWRVDLRKLQGTDLNRFVGVSQQNFDAAVEQMLNEEKRFEERIRREWAPGECGKAQAFGVTLLQHLHVKLEPWFDGGAQPDGLDTRIDATEKFLMAVAIELESLVNPGVRAQFPGAGKRPTGTRP